MRLGNPGPGSVALCGKVIQAGPDEEPLRPGLPSWVFTVVCPPSRTDVPWTDTLGIVVTVMTHRRRVVAALGVVVQLSKRRLQTLVPICQTAARGLARISRNIATSA